MKVKMSVNTIEVVLVIVEGLIFFSDFFFSLRIFKDLYTSIYIHVNPWYFEISYC